MPVCDSVNDVNTPTAYSGISFDSLPPKIDDEHAGRDREHEHAVAENTSRSPRFASWRGR